uniref:Uncharacterized protein n=1 Tax=Phasianus colchicus TaxID=9054 RepID=A0A669QRQ3_PHACC
IKEFSQRHDNCLFVCLLWHFFLCNELHKHAMFLVDSLWDCTRKRLHEWDRVSTMLLWDALTDCQKALLELLAITTTWVTQGQPPPRMEITPEAAA